MRKTISEILKTNGFYKKGNTYDRDDGIQVWNGKHKYVATSVGGVFYGKKGAGVNLIFSTYGYY